MIKNLQLVSNVLLKAFKDKVPFNPLASLSAKSMEKIPFDYFQFYTSVSSVYSSKIEGEEIEVDSYIKHKLLKVQYEPDYTHKANDLYAAYEFIVANDLTADNVLKAHTLLSQHLLAPSQRGRIRNNPMFVINEADRIEYIASEPSIVKSEWEKLFEDIQVLQMADLTVKEAFYYAAFIHLVFLKIHPLQDGNGRTARLIEKWFLKEQLGVLATAIELEKNYYVNKAQYYYNIRKIGLDYDTLDYTKSLDFLLMTVGSFSEK